MDTSMLRTLTVRGVLFGTITDCGETIPLKAWENVTWKSSIAGWEQLAFSSVTKAESSEDISAEDLNTSDHSWSDYVNSELESLSRKLDAKTSAKAILTFPYLQILLGFVNHLFSHAMPSTGMAGENRPDKVLVNWLKIYLACQGKIPWPKTGKNDSNELVSMLASRMTGWKFATTKLGFWASVPDAAVVGDCLGLISGADLPLLLRRTSRTQNTFQLVGPSFVRGMIFREVWGELKKAGVLKLRDFTLV